MEVLERQMEEQGHSRGAEDFARTLISGVLANSEEIDNIITAFAPNWPVNQMAIIDRNILRMAIYEIRIGDDTPPKVAVNEAVELAKVFGSDSSPKFVNGVLGSVMETVKRESYS
jgi:N utilization substance protein B